MAEDATELVFKSGARTSAHADRLDLVPPELMRAAAQRFEMGLKKYSKDNWKKGVRDQEFLVERANHMAEHMLRYLSGDFSEDTEEENLGAIAWAVSVLLYARARGYSIHGQAQEQIQSENVVGGF